ncbi:Na(+)/H(+) antiporter subunit C [Galactobacter valiniphilus]|uniref:Na(+)/H(+) antiporter subunit C n=1 Tax=Galactobacter valiniphilus TaxID=2676122 RepID=UPI0018F36CC2|nr:Na(+)/H(+) antiporter subunit C [Galactobacter valiniphilus]
MTVNVTLLVVMAVLFAAGIYQLTERSLTRVLLGIVLIGNGANLLLLATAGRPGKPPLVTSGTPAEDYSDPLPQALILTAIVITFAVTAFMLGIIYRSWWLSRQDLVQDDTEDRRVAENLAYDAEDDAELPQETTEFATEDEVASDDDGGLGVDPDCATPAQAAAKRAAGRRAVDAHASALAQAIRARAADTGDPEAEERPGIKKNRTEGGAK